MSRRSSRPTGLVWRGKRAYFDRRHERFRGGRLAISLRTSDPDLAHERHAVLTQLMQRGDWSVLEAIRAGDMHISDAQAALREGDMERLRRKGADVPRLGPAIERFMQRKEATRAAGTVAQYRVRLRRFVEAHDPDLDMSSFTSQEARDYLFADKEHAGGRPWAPTTQEAVRVCLGALWQMVMDEESEAKAQRGVASSIKANPWKGLDMPELRPTRAVFLAPEEWRDLDRSMVGQPYRVLVGFAFLAGLRQSEIRYLRPGIDVLIEDPEPIVRVQSRVGGHPWRTKTRRSERDVPITPALVRIIRDHIDLGYSGDRYLIRVPGEDAPISDGTAMRWTREAFEVAGIEYGRDGDGLTLHSGRHTYASWLAQEAVPLNVVAALIGDTTKVVEEVYAHLVPDTYRTAVQHIERKASYNDLPEAGR
jgi:integrase